MMNKNRRPVLKLGVVDLGIEAAKLPNGLTLDLAVIRHPGAAAVVAIDEGRRVAMIRQYRYAVGGYLWEIPAGCRNSNENPRQCAERELLEEAGLRARRWNRLGAIFTIPSFCDEKIDLFLARELSPGHAKTDADEVISMQKISLEKLFTMIQDGQIVDAKTIVALNRTRELLGRAGQ